MGPKPCISLEYPGRRVFFVGKPSPKHSGAGMTSTLINALVSLVYLYLPRPALHRPLYQKGFLGIQCRHTCSCVIKCTYDARYAKVQPSGLPQVKPYCLTHCTTYCNTSSPLFNPHLYPTVLRTERRLPQKHIITLETGALVS